MDTPSAGAWNHTSDEWMLTLLFRNCPDFFSRIKAIHFHLNMSVEGRTKQYVALDAYKYNKRILNQHNL